MYFQTAASRQPKAWVYRCSGWIATEGGILKSHRHPVRVNIPLSMSSEERSQYEMCTGFEYVEADAPGMPTVLPNGYEERPNVYVIDVLDNRCPKTYSGGEVKSKPSTSDTSSPTKKGEGTFHHPAEPVESKQSSTVKLRPEGGNVMMQAEYELHCHRERGSLSSNDVRERVCSFIFCWRLSRQN